MMLPIRDASSRFMPSNIATGVRSRWLLFLLRNFLSKQRNARAEGSARKGNADGVTRILLAHSQSELQHQMDPRESGLGASNTNQE
jgi:hypothetical protein